MVIARTRFPDDPSPYLQAFWPVIIWSPTKADAQRFPSEATARRQIGEKRPEWLADMERAEIPLMFETV